MGVQITEATIGIWYVAMPDQDYLACLSRLPEGGCELTWRYRYYESKDPWDGQDRKNWYTATNPALSEAEGANACQIVARDLARMSGGELTEILRGTGTLQQFMDEFMKLPFVHYKIVSEEEAAAQTSA